MSACDLPEGLPEKPERMCPQGKGASISCSNRKGIFGAYCESCPNLEALAPAAGGHGAYPPGLVKDTTKALPPSEFYRYGEGKARTEQLPDTGGKMSVKTGFKEPCGSSLDALEKSLHDHFDAAQLAGEMSWNDDVPYIKGLISNVIADFREQPPRQEGEGITDKERLDHLENAPADRCFRLESQRAIDPDLDDRPKVELMDVKTLRRSVIDLARKFAEERTENRNLKRRAADAEAILREFVSRWDRNGFYDISHEDLIDQSRQLLEP